MDLSERLREIAETGTTTTSWSTGGPKRPDVGDRAILLRVGRSPKGLVGLGTIVREPYEAPHWDTSRASLGEQTTFVDIRFSQLAAEPLLSVDELKDILPEELNLFTQSPCMSVPEEVAERIVDQL